MLFRMGPPPCRTDVWNPATGGFVNVPNLTLPSGCGSLTSPDPTGTLALQNFRPAGGSPEVRLIELSAGRVRWSIAGDVRSYPPPAFSHDGARVAFRENDGSTTVIDVRRGSVIGTLPTQAETGRVALSPDGSRLAVGSAISVSLWDVRTRRFLMTLPSLAGTFDVKRWTLASNPFASIPNLYNGADAMRFSDDGSRFHPDAGHHGAIHRATELDLAEVAVRSRALFPLRRRGAGWSEGRETADRYRSFAASACACFKSGTSASACFHSVRKSW